MNKIIFSVVWRVLVLIGSIAIGMKAYQIATLCYSFSPLVGIVCSSGTMSLVDINSFSAEMANENCSIQVANPSLSTDQGTLEMIKDGAKIVLISGNTSDPTEIFAQASAHNTTLIFVGANLQQSLLDNYDKAWVLDNNTAHGGQLLGKKAALAFREGTMADGDKDQLMDYIALLPDDYPDADVIIQEFLSESEHYGVYSEEIYTFTSSISTISSSINKVWESVTISPEEAGQSSDTKDSVAAESFDNNTNHNQPEIILCAGSRAAQIATQHANQSGWFSCEFPTEIAVLAENRDSAAELEKTGSFNYIVYYDMDRATRILAEFTRNVLNNRYVAQGCDIQPDSEKHFIIGYQILE